MGHRASIAFAGWGALIAAMGTNVAAADTKQPGPSPPQAVQPLDSERAEQARAVLRVRLLRAEGGDKYSWDEVEVLGVLKAPADVTFGKRLRIAHYSWEPGIPKRQCTVYLEEYGQARSLWRLLGGSAKQGVSNPLP